ncbi:MAG: D-2-hydroxyacid dehydrogenase family protein, partial [Roseomonas sp.]|nr:D-2-hydroxyacid dehydrogenase family protein [Roseomonas sp.]
MPMLKRLAILDDYQGVALSMGPWSRLQGLEIEVFRDTLADRDALVRRLAPFDAILGMRERTPFPAGLIERLPNLKLLITTGERNRGFDVAAAKA